MPVKKKVASSGRGVAQLRQEVHEYHMEVTKTLSAMQENCKHCHSTVHDLDLQINGEKPERDNAPSMKNDISSLKQSRDSVRTGVRWLWTVVVGVGGLLISIFSIKKM
jgi:hypothetical protein